VRGHRPAARSCCVIGETSCNWNLPGGAVEAGEAPWDADMRRVREHVSLGTEVELLTDPYVKPDSDEMVFTAA